MPGFLSWISGFFSNTQPAAPVSEPRLFNPANDQSVNEDSEIRKQLAHQLEEHLFCWLLDAEPSVFEEDLAPATEVLEELQDRLGESQLDELPRVYPGS